MKKQNIFKIIIIFLLLISFVGTGFFGSYIKNAFLFGFGFLYYWVSALLILFLLASMTKKRYRKKFNKFLLIMFFAFLSIDLLFTLINSSKLLSDNYLLNQILITPENITDKIGLFQSFIVFILFGLFGYPGVYIGSLILMLIAVFLVLDVDVLINKIFNKKNKKNKKNSSKTRAADNKKQQQAKEKAKQKKKEESQRKKELKKEKKENEENKEGKKSTLGDMKTNFAAPFLNKDQVKEEQAKQEQAKEEKRTEEETNESDLFEMRIPIKGRTKVSAEKSGSEQEEVIEENEIIQSSEIEHGSYVIPSVDLLDDISTNEQKYETLKEEALRKKKSLEEALNSFSVKAKVKNITVGSTITKYELQPEPGQKVNKFSSLTNDLAMALEASSTRIEAPIPGKSLVGIEIPNSEKLMVGLKEIIKANDDKSNKLKVALGEDIEGNAKFIEIDKTPHLLIAGATGSGKSVCINSIITSILLQATPNEVKFLLVDPKKVELTPYEGIPHLLAPVITDAKKATIALNKLVLEMERRYELFTETKTRNIISYNQSKDKEEKLPYIVAIIDELADLMMVASADIEASISRIAQKARAAGIHLILATQRPSTDVITGLIKSNIPSRISFMVSSSIDSRTILDSKGAESLLGHGDMLLSRAGKPGFERIQGGYLSDEEIHKVVEVITEQIKDEQIDNYYEEDFLKLEKEQVSDNIDNGEQEDELIEQAIQIGIDAQRISTSLLQRKLKIGYNRAANLIEDLEEKGYVTKPDGNKGRKIIMERINKENE